MSRQTHSHVYFALLILVILMTALGNSMVSAAGSNLPPEPTSARERQIRPTSFPTITPTPAMQIGVKPQVWLDGAIDLDQFPPKGSLIVHFNTPMSLGSSPAPILSWPSVEGVTSWNSTSTILTFIPTSALDSKKTYTFFLDPALRSADGDPLTNAPEWIAHVQKGPSVISVSPNPGALDTRYHFIEIQFDRPMNTSGSSAIFAAEPAVPFELGWKNDRVLEVSLQQPLEPNQRYDFTLNGGNDESTLFAADGSYLAEDYRLFYWQKPFQAHVTPLGAKGISVKFNYPLDQEKTGMPFILTPGLSGEWKWFSSQEIHFTTREAIPASLLYTLTLQHPLVDAKGFEISTTLSLSFSGLSPIRLAIPNTEQRQDTVFADPDLETIRIEFDVPVDHASAENAFSIRPQLRGKFHWEKAIENIKEVLVYELDELLQPSTTYTVKITPTILDTQGHIMIIQPYEKSIMAGSRGYLSQTFGEYGDNIQVVDANGPRRIQFGGAESDTSFAAYHFDLMEFAKLYADHYHYRHYGENVRDIPIPGELEPTAVWKNIKNRQVNEGTITETILPVELPSGLYVLNMRSGKVLYDQMFLVVTQNTLVVKNNGKDLFVWLTDINGGNVPDAEVRLYSTTGEKIREGKTDENGQYRVSIPTGSEPMLVSARVDQPGLAGDVALSGLEDWYSSFPYNYDDHSYQLPEGQPYLTYIYTERPVYRPGQVVNFKAIVRKDNDVRYTLPEESTPVKIRIQDARGNALDTQEHLTNRFGSVNGTVTIPEGAMLGDYKIETEVDGVITSQTFKVEDYRKPDYQIQVTSLQPDKQNKFVRGEEMKVKVNAAYFFGEPLAKKNLEVKFYRYWQIDASVKGSLVTDENGETTLTFPAPFDENSNSYYWDGDPAPQQVRMEVTAQDGSNQMVAGVYQFTVYPANVLMSLDTDGYFIQPNTSFMVTARSQDLLGQPIVARKLTLTTASWDRERFQFHPPQEKLTLQTNPNGTASGELKLDAGYHELSLSGKDTLGNTIQVNRWVYVFSGREDWYFRSRDEFLTVSTEKDAYKPYDKARVAIESTFSGPALLTFERGSVINSKMVELTAPLTIVETEIIPEYAPNVYMTVNAWQAGSSDVSRQRYFYNEQTNADSYLRLAKTEIQVDSTTKALDISITTDKETYTPGEKLSAVIQVKDSIGKPVQAELSLAVVDEAIFALADDPSGDIFNAFYGPRQHSVSTYDSMAPYRIIMDQGGMGGGGDDMPPAARSNFLDTSAWYPVIETDANGQATVTVDLPDNTTSWRLTVKAISLNHQVGQGITNIETKKDIFVRPVLPRVLTNGDLATLTAFVHNYSIRAQTMNVNLSAPGLEIRSQNNEKITIRPGQVLPIGWQVLVQSAKSTEVTITVRNDNGVIDSVILPLALQPAAIRDVQNQSGQFTGTLSLTLPLPDVEKETSEVRLSLNRSMSGTLLNGLEYLTGYPYGCVEQTMSRALPNAVVGHAADQLRIGGPEMQAQLDPLIKASIQRLYGLQHSDGGWGWWTDDGTDPYQTAWVLFGLGIMDNAGYSIEPKVMDNAAKWLKDEMNRNEDLDPRIRAYALYSMALAGRGDLEKTETLVSESIYELDPFSQAALALAMHKLGKEEPAQAILNILSESALQQDGYVYWPQPSYDGEYHHKTMSSTIRTTALVLQAFAEIEPDNTLVAGIVKYLADQRQGIYGWGTTNETSFTILALTEYLVNEESKSGTSPYDVLVNGQNIASGTLEPGNTSASLNIPVSELKAGVNSITVRTQGDDPLYFDLSTRYDLLQSNVQAAGNIQVTRRYLDPATGSSLEKFQAGQVVKVEVKIEVPENAYFLAVEDHLPGGLEALNEGLSATNDVSYGMWGYENYIQYYWQDYGYNYKEIRGDRVVFFITSFEKGSHTFSFYARATTPGQFLALPAQVYAMYDTDLWGRSQSASIKINK